MQADIKEVRNETRELISTLSSVINAISVSTNQSVAVNLPGSKEAQEAQDKLSIALTGSSDLTREERKFLANLIPHSLDMYNAIDRLRKDLDRELIRILGQQVASECILGKQGSSITMQAMFERLESALQRFKNMKKSFLFILRVSNAAIHGQPIPYGIGLKAIEMGFRMLRELKIEEELEW